MYIRNDNDNWADPTATQMGYFSGPDVQHSLHQDTGYNWNSGDIFTLSIDAYEPGFRILDSGDQLTIRLVETGGTVLWESAIDLDGTVLSQGGTTTEIQGEISFNGSPTNVFTIDSSTDFLGGTSGSEIRVQIQQTGGVTYFDNVTLSAVPEPSSTALLGLAGLSFILRRRR